MPGGRIIIWSEQGLGDNIQFVRYAPMVRERCAHVTLAIMERSHRLFLTAPGIDATMVSDHDVHHLDDYDAWVPAMSLGHIFGTTVETIPADVPYLFPPETPHPLVAERLDVPGLKVGFCWRGNPRHRHDLHRRACRS